MDQYQRSFFVAGGNLPSGSPSYVTRPADHILRQSIIDGELCIILHPRQTGKSSLMVETIRHLREQEGAFHPAIIDLTFIGTKVNENQWYISLINEIKRQLQLKTNVNDWWGKKVSGGNVTAFIDFLRDVVLSEVEGQIVIFIDEIDSTLNLEFSTDDFFAAIRAIYNSRATENVFNRLSFVIIGTAISNDLIQNPARTPFNIGRKIELDDFTLEEAKVFLEGLPNQSESILERIIYWTDGHPYLTQRIGREIAEKNGDSWSDKDVDSLVSGLFFADRNLLEDSNLGNVHKSVTFDNTRGIHRFLPFNHQKRSLLNLYRQVYDEDKSVVSNEKSFLQNRLKLSGLVKVNKQGVLTIRNNIYHQVFNDKWIEKNTPINWIPILVGITILSLLMALGAFWLRPKPNEVLAQSYISDFENSSNPTLQLSNLANLFELPDYKEEAIGLFNNLTHEEQIAIFDGVTPDLQPQAQIVTQEMYLFQYADDLTTLPQNTDLLQAMWMALDQSSDEDTLLSNEIKHWVEGRVHMIAREYKEARFSYSVAIGLNANNPATYLERSLAHAGLEDYDAAADDLVTAVTLDPSLQNRIEKLVEDEPTLFATIWQGKEQYAQLIAFVPTPTHTITPSPTITASPTPTNTPTPSSTNTPTPTHTPIPTNTSTPTETPPPTNAPTPTSTPLPPPPPPDHLVIDRPGNGAGVSRRNSVSGRVPLEDTQSGKFVNIIVIAPSEGSQVEYWVQEKPTTSTINGYVQWTSNPVYIGREDPEGQEDIGKTYEICAVLLDVQLLRGQIGSFPASEKPRICILVKRTS